MERCCRAFGVLDLIFERMFFQERDRWRALRRAEAGVVSRVRVKAEGSRSAI